MLNKFDHHDNQKTSPVIRIIDDDDAMRKSWAFLIEDEGWEVVTYPDALTFLSSNDFIRPGCILLDVRMPQMSGLELQTKLRDLGCDLPIIFVSGHGDIDMAVNTLKAGAALTETCGQSAPARHDRQRCGEEPFDAPQLR